MTTTKFFANKQKAQKSLMMAYGAVVVGAILFVIAITADISYSMTGFWGAFGGAFIGGGVMVISTNSHFAKSKEPVLLVSADENGVTLYVSKDTYKTISYDQINEIKYVSNGALNKAVVFSLVNPQEYLASLSPKDAKLAKNNEKMFKSPCAVMVSLSESSNTEIANALAQAMSQNKASL